MTTKLVATGAFLAFLASASIALAEDKVTLCHVTESDSNPFVLITVSSNAVPAHVAPPPPQGGRGGGGRANRPLSPPGSRGARNRRRFTGYEGHSNSPSP